MGGGLARRRGRLRPFLLQHHPDAGRRHARTGPAQRAAARPEGPRRAHRPSQARRRAHHRRRDGRLRRADVGLHPRAGIPGPDQGPACDAPRRSASSRARCATRSTIGSPRRRSQAGQAARLGRSSRPRSASAAGKEKEVSRKTATRKLRLPGKLADCTNSPAQGRKSSSSRAIRRRLGQAGARPRNPGGAAVARQDPQRRQRRHATSSRRTSNSPI